jgi:hypothetical protein
MTLMFRMGNVNPDERRHVDRGRSARKSVSTVSTTAYVANGDGLAATWKLACLAAHR